MGLSIVGLLNQDEAEDMKFISKVFLVSIRIKELIEEQKVNKNE